VRALRLGVAALCAVLPAATPSRRARTHRELLLEKFDDIKIVWLSTKNYLFGRLRSSVDAKTRRRDSYL
jgi:hypothetical protein